MVITYERLRELRFLGVTPETECCANCEHFRQHYDKDGGLIFAGHCCYPRMKPREPYRQLRRRPPYHHRSGDREPGREDHPGESVGG